MIEERRKRWAYNDVHDGQEAAAMSATPIKKGSYASK